MDNVTAHSTTNPATVPASSYVDAYVPPSAAGVTMPPNPIGSASMASDSAMSTPTPVQTPLVSTPAPAVPTGTAQTEELEDQNIFVMLGVMDGTPEQRETFLDELQQVIWEDFLEYDVRLLITKDEQTQLDTLINEQGTSELEKQEKIVVYLEKLVPDLEEIMLEKALDLKEEMMRERVKGMKEYFTDKSDIVTQLQKAEEMMNVGKWYSAATLLNSIR